jgi:hypothetical protein
MFGALLLIGLAACSPAPGGVVAEEEAAPVPVQPVSDDVRAECAKNVKRAETAGLVRKVERDLMRLTVDEPTWREMGPDGREAMMAFAVCDWFGVRLGDLASDQRVTIIGWQSGERLVSSMGGLYDGVERE